MTLPVAQWLDEDDALHEETLRERIVASVQAAYDEKAAGIGPGMRRQKQIMLQVLDTLWKKPPSDGPVASGDSSPRL